MSVSGSRSICRGRVRLNDVSPGGYWSPARRCTARSVKRGCSGLLLTGSAPLSAMGPRNIPHGMVPCMKLEGIHHVTCVTADAPANADFYVRVLGLRIVKKTINQTDQTTYHLFYGDEKSSYGNNISFFEYRGRPDGRAGAGNVHRIVWRVGSTEALDFWERRLSDEGCSTERGETTLLFADHEGLDHELAVVDVPDEPLTGEAPDIPADFALQGFDGVRAYARDQAASEAFIRERLGFQDMGDGRLEARGDEWGGWYAFDPAPAEKRRFGGGVVQHVAWGCLPPDIEAWHDVVESSGLKPTEVI